MGYKERLPQQETKIMAGKIRLSQEQEACFEQSLKNAIYRNLHNQQFLTDEQLNELLGRSFGSEEF